MTLLEIVISFSLLLFGVLAVAQIAPLLLQGQRLGEQHVAAAQYAQHFMEFEMAKSYDTVVAESNPGGSQSLSSNPLSSLPLVSTVIPGVPSNPVYRYNIYWNQVSNGYSTKPFVCITVQVSWTDPSSQRSGTPQIYSLVCYKTPPPGVP